MAESGDGLLNVRETARALGVHENTVRNWQAKGLLRCARLPSGVRRFDRADVERMRREMLEEFAPATPMPPPSRRPVKGRTLTREDWDV